MRNVGEDAYSDMISFLQEQEELGVLPEPLLFEPIVRTKPDRIFIGKGSRIDSFVKLEGGELLEIGSYVHIASFAHLGIGGGSTIVKDYAAVASGAKIISGSNLTSAESLSAAAPEMYQKVQKSVTVLERFSCALTNSVVLPGVVLHEGAILAAGGVATKDIPEWEIWGGVPARFLAKREVRK